MTKPDITERLKAASALLPDDHFAPTRVADLREARAEIERLRREMQEAWSALRPLAEAARSLSYGTDWNNGTHAKVHGARQKLLDALPAALEALKDRAP